MEIWHQTEGKVDYFLSGAGTTGTFTGNARRLKELKPGLKAYLAQPDSPFHGIEGMKHLDSTIVPGIFDKELPDGIIRVRTEDCYEMVRYLARKQGLLVGISSGANLLAASRLAKQVEGKAMIVTILCDGGYHYFGEPVWSGLL